MKKITKNIILLGSTGSIGTQTLNVCRRLNLEVKGLSCHKNIDLAFEQIKEFKPKYVNIVDADAASKLQERLLTQADLKDIKVTSGVSGLIELAKIECDRLVMAIIGFAALDPLLAAIKKGRKIAMANKETIVALGEYLLDLVRDYKAELLPVDSEPSAIWQASVHSPNPIEKIILTASGGPFKDLPKSEFSKITLEDALNHPIWSMGNKITIDSATMMNKGLEMIEISHLFQISEDNIEIIVHPEGIIHSIVEYVDGAVLGQMGLPDMELPIQYAITFDQRMPMPDKEKLDFAKLAKMTFFAADQDKFPCLKLAYYAKKSGGSMPAVLNAADEMAVEAFSLGLIRFDQIPQVIDETLDHFVNHPLSKPKNIQDILKADEWARAEAEMLIHTL